MINNQLILFLEKQSPSSIKGVYAFNKASDVELDYGTSVLQLQPAPHSKITTHIRYNINEGSVIGIRDLNRIITNIDYLVRGIPSRLRSILRYARNYPAEKRSITSLQTELVADVKEIQRLIKAGAPEFKLVFIKLENAKRIALTLIDYIVCLLYTSPSPRDATLSRMPSSA